MSLSQVQKYYYDTELIRQLWCKINEEWAEKWATDFGGISLILDELNSKDKFYDKLRADIFEIIKAIKGERIAKNYIIEKDTIENHLKNDKQQITNTKSKGFLSDKSRNAYCYYLEYEAGYGAYTKLFDFETLRNQYQAIPTFSKELMVQPKPSQISLVVMDKETNKVIRIIGKGENNVMKGGLIILKDKIIKPAGKVGLLFLIYYIVTFAYQYYQTLPLFTEKQLADVKFTKVFSTNSINKATVQYAFDVRSLGLNPEKDTVRIYTGYNYTNSPNYHIIKSAKLLDTLRAFSHWKPDIDTARLFVKGKIIAKIPLLIPTNKKFIGWGKGQAVDWFDRLVNLEQLSTKGTAHIPRDSLEPKIRKSYYTEFICIDTFNFNIDTCTFTYRAKNPDQTAINPNDINFYINDLQELNQNMQDDGALSQHFGFNYIASATNVEYLYQVNTQGYVGKKLAKFGAKMQANRNEYKEFRIEFRYPTVRIYVDNELYEETQYTKPLGKLYKMALLFKGSGMVDWVKITGKSGKELYFEDFGGKAAW